MSCVLNVYCNGSLYAFSFIGEMDIITELWAKCTHVRLTLSSLSLNIRLYSLSLSSGTRRHSLGSAAHRQTMTHFTFALAQMQPRWQRFLRHPQYLTCFVMFGFGSLSIMTGTSIPSRSLQPWFKGSGMSDSWAILLKAIWWRDQSTWK